MDTAKWADFPHDKAPFQYPGDKLAEAWEGLHRGDTEPLPADDGILEAWRRFHAGDFAGAVALAEKTGSAAHAVANKASGIYADYLEEDEDRKIAIYQAGIARAERAIGEWQDDANAHYFHAFLLGRYSQSISIAQALAKGIGGKVRDSLESALSLSPEHAEAHTALGLYHAEIVNKVGKMVGKLTYGASADKALEHFERALELTPEAPIAHIEYGNGLYLLFGDKRLEESNAAYEKAASIEPIDAMQKLDVEYAKASI
jgi:tetratricopeptide (TPR) repeat protein